MSDAYIETLIPRSGLASWHKYEAGVSGNEIIYDYSGNSRTIQCSVGNEPVLTTDVVNSRPGWYFNGSRDPLVYTGTFTPKHIFVVGAYADAAFPAVSGAGEYAGLVSGKDTANYGILIGNPSSTKFYNVGYGSGHEYRRRDAVYAESDMQAAMSNDISVFEVSLTTGWALDGIQVGKDRTYANRKWKGYFVEMLMFTRVLSDLERFLIYEYLAIKFQLWKRDAAGLDVWPFSTDWGRPLAVGKRVVSSVSVSGAYKARSKGTKKMGVEPQFESRTIEEYDTAVEFWNAKYPGTNFIYRDDSFYPSRDTEMRFVSNIEQNGQSFQDINYSWQAEEV